MVCLKTKKIEQIIIQQLTLQTIPRNQSQWLKKQLNQMNQIPPQLQ